MYIKNLQCQILRSDSDQKGLVSFVASTANVDRYGDVVNQGGWDLDKFRSNPVILLNHNANSLPIGRGEVEVIDGRLMVDVEFDMGDPQAAEVARKTKEGFLNAVSVGFNPIDATPRSMLEKNHPAHGESGQYFDRAELLEISIVTIPANGDAVAAKGYDMQNRTFKISNLKHILDVEILDDVVVVTYAKNEQPQEIEEEQETEEIEEIEEVENLAYSDDDEDEDKDKEKNFLTPQERDFLRSLLNGDNQ